MTKINVKINIAVTFKTLQFLQACSDNLIFPAIFVGCKFLCVSAIDQQRRASQGSLILALSLINCGLY